MENTLGWVGAVISVLAAGVSIFMARNSRIAALSARRSADATERNAAVQEESLALHKAELTAAADAAQHARVVITHADSQVLIVENMGEGEATGVRVVPGSFVWSDNEGVSLMPRQSHKFQVTLTHGTSFKGEQVVWLNPSGESASVSVEPHYG